jgi:hypothetical protein
MRKKNVRPACRRRGGFDERSKNFLSDEIARHHFREIKSYLPRPKYGLFFYERFLADDFHVRFSTQGATPFALG